MQRCFYELSIYTNGSSDAVKWYKGGPNYLLRNSRDTYHALCSEMNLRQMKAAPKGCVGESAPVPLFVGAACSLAERR